MTHASEKQPYGCSQPRMVELRSRLPLRMVELRSRLPLPGYRNPRLHPSKMTMNFMMDLAAAEAEDEEVEAEDEQDSGTASGGHLPPLLRATPFQQLKPHQVPSRTTWGRLGPIFSGRSPPHRRRCQHRIWGIGARWPPASGVGGMQPRPLARQRSSNPKPATRR